LQYVVIHVIQDDRHGSIANQGLQEEFMKAHFAIIVASIALLPVSLSAESGPKPACNIEDPPAQCAGAWYASAEALVAGTGIPYDKSDPVCGSNDNGNALKEVLEFLSNRPDASRFKDAAGDVFKFVRDSGLWSPIVNGAGGEVHNILMRNGPKAAYANCVNLAVFIPKEAKVVAFRMRNVDIDAAPGPERIGGCEPGKDCSNGFSRFIFYPDTQETSGTEAVGTVFANWSHNRRRVGQFHVFFTMPPGKTVLAQW
jgi:hypothetical protein